MGICTEWVTEEDVALCYDGITSADQDVIDLSIEAASEILYALTGRQFPGECQETLRPCSNSGSPAGFSWQFWAYPWYPIRLGGQWINTGPCGCHMASCGCKPYPRLNLGRDDVQSVDQVLIDGQAFTDFTLYESSFLVRTDGGRWPCCQDLTKDDSEEGTWSVDITYGWPIPQALKRAAAVLAAEFIRGCSGDECRLPPRTLSVVKQGVNIQVSGVLQELQAGLTGLSEVDMAIVAYNPNGLARPPRVWTPDRPRIVVS